MYQNTLCADIRQLCLYIYLIGTMCSEQCDHNKLVCIHSTLLAYASEQMYWPPCIYMSHCTSTVVYTPHSFTHPLKSNNMQHILTKLLQNIFQKQMCPLDVVYMSNAQFTLSESMGEVWQYVCLVRSHCDQNCGL